MRHYKFFLIVITTLFLVACNQAAESNANNRTSTIPEVVDLENFDNMFIQQTKENQIIDDDTSYVINDENEILVIKELLNEIEIKKVTLKPDDIEHTFNDAGNTYLNIVHEDTGDVYTSVTTTIFVSEEGDVIIWSSFSSGNEPEIYESNNQVELYQELNNIKNK